jgi:hypothetical protein
VGEGRPLSPGRFGKEQGRPQRDADSGGPGESATDPESGGTSTPASEPSDDHESEGDDSSPLVPIGIGLAVAIVVLGGSWFASRRLTAKS